MQDTTAPVPAVSETAAADPAVPYPAVLDPAVPYPAVLDADGTGANAAVVDATAADPAVTTSSESAGPVPLVPVADPVADRVARVRARRRAISRGPLPDAVAIRSVAIPETAPPYDDANGKPGRARSSSGVRHRAPRNRPFQPVGDAAATAAAAAAAAAAAQPPVTSAWPSQFAQVLAETLAGSRQPDQIVPWTTEQARRRINQLGPLLATSHRPRIRRVIVTSPVGGVLEMTVIVGLGAQVRALAVRLERVQPTQSGQPSRPGQPGTRQPGQPVSRQPGQPGSRQPGQPGTRQPDTSSRLSQPDTAGRRGAAGPGQPATMIGRPGGSSPMSYSGRPDNSPRWYCTAIEAA